MNDSTGNEVPASQTLPGQGGDDFDITVFSNVSVESLLDKGSESSDQRGEHVAAQRRRLKPLPGTVEYTGYAGYIVNVGQDDGVYDLPQIYAAETAEDDLEHSKPQSDSSSHMKPNHSLPSYALLDQRRDPHWLHDRQLVLSEMAFKVDMFAKTALYEMLPISIATLCCTCLDGWQQARNRFHSFFCLIFLPIFDIIWSATAALICYCIFKDHLTKTAGYELLGFTYLPLFGRAVTLAIKYALYSDALLSVDNDLALHSKEYQTKGMRNKNQMGSYILNGDGYQKEGLVHFIYASMLYADTDLSQCHLIYNVSTPRRAEGPDDAQGLTNEDDVAAIRAFSRSLLHMLRDLADFNRIVAEIDTDASGDLTLAELRQSRHLRAMSDAEVLTSEEDLEVGECFKQMDLNHDGVLSKQELQRVHDMPDADLEACDPGGQGGISKLTSGIFLHGVPQYIMKQRRGIADNRRLADTLLEGEIPCSLAALHIIVGCMSCSKSARFFLTANLILLPFLYVFLGAIMRCSQGRDPYGTTWQETFFYCARILPELQSALQLQLFALGPCLWYWRQLLIAHRLLDLIDPPRVADMRWQAAPAEPKQPEPQLPILDLTVPSNVEGWSSMRRVAFGRNYAPAVEFKFQLYVSVTLCIFLLSALANTLGSLAMAAQEQQPLDFIAVGCARAVGFGVPIIVQILLAYKLNRFGFSFIEALQCQSLKCAAFAATLQDLKGEHLEAEVARLDRAANMLTAAAAEIEAEMESRPMRVIFVKADPGAASMMISIIMTVIGFQIYGASALKGFVS